MIIETEYKNIKLENKQAVTIGTFDGFHRGHKKIIEHTLHRAAEENLDSCVVIIDSVPDHEKLLTTREEKFYLFERIGVDRVIVFKKNGSWRNMPAGAFVEDFLIERLNCSHLSVGKDFKFGSKREGDRKILEKYSPGNFKLDIHPLEKYKGQKISSSNIRRQLKKGNLEKVNKLLGRNYFFMGRHIKGKKIGRQLGTPTVNFNVGEKKLLPLGVFGAKAIIKDGREVLGACFIGPVRVGKHIEKEKTVELNILEYSGGIEKKIVCVELVNKIRDPKKFTGKKQLKAQINKDITKIKKKSKIR
ncbi:MAG: riboflavin biosynthesis protein RibF [Elusimicrobiota bacterium]